jgi:DNA mismatch repair protein MutS2
VVRRQVVGDAQHDGLRFGGRGAGTEQQREAERRAAERATRIDTLVQSFEAEASAVLRTVSAAATELAATASAMTETAEDGTRQATVVAAASEQAIKQGPADARALKEVERKIAEVARQVAVGGALEPRKADEPDRAEVRSVTVGMKVFVPRLRTEAEVIEVLGGGQVRVAAGPLKLLTSVDELKQAKVAPATKGSGSAKAAHKKPHPLSFDAAADPEVPIQTSDNTVDLRGMRAHEAVAAAEQFLDRCLNRGLRVAFLIHGHGTGALRKEVRDAVRASSYVERSRPGEPREGGDGVTVVWLR